jgi:diaminopimelate dehydrogenase
MRRRRIAIVGFGRLGTACATELRASDAAELAGVVRRPDATAQLPQPFAHVAVGTHLRDLGHVDAALICVPPPVATAVACATLQLRTPIVECAMLEGGARTAHLAAIADAARHHRVAAVVGAGWDPGLFPLLRHAFDVLIPEGETEIVPRPGVSLHHSEAARNVAGVRAALAAEYRGVDGRRRRYVYAELAKGADPGAVQAALAADPLFADEETLLFPVESVAALEASGHGVLVERRGTARSGAHQNIVFEARFDVPTFAARVMVDAALRLADLAPGLHRYSIAG